MDLGKLAVSNGLFCLWQWLARIACKGDLEELCFMGLGGAEGSNEDCRLQGAGSLYQFSWDILDSLELDISSRSHYGYIH